MFEIVSRREAMKTIGLGALAASLGCATGGAAPADDKHNGAPPVPTVPGPYELPPLPYTFDALEPVLDETTVRIHYTRHTAGYVRALNATLKKLDKSRIAGDFASVRALERDLAFNGSGAVLHALYWSNLKPGGGTRPEGALRDAISRDFGSFDAFKAQLLAATTHVQGSGWGILAYEPLGRRLLILQAENHQDQAIWGARPLLAIDVWEHAYYLQYENRRGEYVHNIFAIIDWPSVAARYARAVA